MRKYVSVVVIGLTLSGCKSDADDMRVDAAKLRALANNNLIAFKNHMSSLSVNDAERTLELVRAEMSEFDETYFDPQFCAEYKVGERLNCVLDRDVGNADFLAAYAFHIGMENDWENRVKQF